MAENKKLNTFAQLDAQASSNNEKIESPTMIRDRPLPVKQAEISIDDFSPKAVGEVEKYERPDLNGTEDVIDKFQVFAVDPLVDQPQDSMNKTSKYWKVQCLLTYESKNEDGINNREYISGAKAFVQKNGSPSDIQFWYNGADTQMSYLWEMVAKKLNIKPDEMSPRQFVAFMNSRPKVMIASLSYKNYGAKPGAPLKINKNMPGQFL